MPQNARPLHPRNRRIVDAGLSRRAIMLHRFSISGDAKPGEPSTSGEFPEANDFAGYRTFEDKFLTSRPTRSSTKSACAGRSVALEFVNPPAFRGRPRPGRHPSRPPSTRRPAAPTTRSPRSRPLSDQIPRVPPVPRMPNINSLPPGPVTAATVCPVGPAKPTSCARSLPFYPSATTRSPSAPTATPATAMATPRPRRLRAVVRRTRDFVDTTEAADILTPPTSKANKPTAANSNSSHSAGSRQMRCEEMSLVSSHWSFS